MMTGMKKGEDYTGISVVYLCHDGQGNFLLAKRSTNCRDEHGVWDCGGGGLEVGDTVLGTLQKEIKEEYCAHIHSSAFLGYRDVHREHNGKKTHWVALDFLVHVDRATVANGEPHKFDEIGWFTLDAFPEPLHSQLPHFLDLYRANIDK